MRENGAQEAGSSCSRLHEFLSSLMASIGGVLVGNRGEEMDMKPSSKIAPLPESQRDGVKKQKGGGNRRALKEISNRNPSDLPITKRTEKKCTHRRCSSCGKKINSLTSVLTARSKAACGVESKPREQIVDIDAADVDNELAVVEYVDEIYKFYRLSEEEYHMRDYMSWQSNINQKMRMIVVDWLIEVHYKFELLPESLYLTIDLMDRYLSRKVVSRIDLQLVGISSMLLACKYEEILAPTVDDFVYIADRAYEREQVLAMEKSILLNLKWNLTVATPYDFLVRFIKATMSSDKDPSRCAEKKQVENMAFLLAEIGLMDYDLVLSCRPSLIAAAAVYAANRALKRMPASNETLRHYTGYDDDDDHEMRRCADKLVRLHLKITKKSLAAVCMKFTDPSRRAIALLPLA